MTTDKDMHPVQVKTKVLAGRAFDAMVAEYSAVYTLPDNPTSLRYALVEAPKVTKILPGDTYNKYEQWIKDEK